MPKMSLIAELKKIRIKITQIYMDLGNLKGLKADMLLKEDIKYLEDLYVEKGDD